MDEIYIVFHSFEVLNEELCYEIFHMIAIRIIREKKLIVACCCVAEHAFHVSFNNQASSVLKVFYFQLLPVKLVVLVISYCLLLIA